MKKNQFAWMLTIVLLGYFNTAILAQKDQSPVRNLFEKYEDSTGISVLFVSKKMFALKYKQVLQNNPDYSEQLINHFNEMIMIGGEDGSAIQQEDIKELVKKLKEKDYEQIVKISERNESLTIQILEDKETGKINDLVVMAIDNSEQIIMSISGTMTLEDIILVSRLFDINILEVLVR